MKIFHFIVFLSFSFFLGGCASVPHAVRPIALDAQQLRKSHFVEFDYVGDDLTGIRYLVQWPRPQPGTARIPCAQASLPQRIPATIGAWIWRSNVLLNDKGIAARFLRKAKSHDIGVINLQVQPDLRSFSGFLLSAEQAGVRVNALSGAPDDVLYPDQPLAVVQNVLRYNESHAHRFSGIQFDIEPYLLKDFERRETEVLDRYLRLLARIRSATAGRLQFGVVVPFWFADKTIHGQNLMAMIAQRVDQLAVMAYRTNLDELLDIANNALCYGERYGKPVFLGLEVTKLPLESHLIIATSRLESLLRIDDGRVVLTRDPRYFENIARRTEVRPSRISFYPDTQAAFSMARATVPYRSFAGWIINGLDEAWFHE